MECKPLDIVIKSAKDLKDVNLFSKMDVYAIVSIMGDYNNNNMASKQKTPIDKDGGTNPKWNFLMKFTVDITAAQQNRLTLVVKLKSERNFGDKDIGEVHVPMKELLDSFGDSKDDKHLSYSVRTPSGKAKGVLDFTYKFGEKFTASAHEHKKNVHDTPVTAYPVGYGAAAGSSAGAAAAYLPPGGYPPPGGMAGAYPYAHPPQGGYSHPPAPVYSGYPPAQGYGGGYQQYPPQPAPYPQAGYGYGGGYGGVRPHKNNGSGGKMAMGLGAGLLGGLIVGDMISDASDMGSYDGGFDDGGFDF